MKEYYKNAFILGK